MIGHSHRIVTLALAVPLAVIGLQSVPAFSMAREWNQPAVVMWMFVFFFVMGGRAPDWLEFPRYRYSKQKGYVEASYPFGHRTLTHWWPFWVAPWVALWMGCMHWNVLSSALLGFSLSGFIHLVLDAMTVGGVPMIHPWGCQGGYRSGRSVLSCFSLKLMKTGQWIEFVYVALFSLAALFFAFYAHVMNRRVIDFFDALF